jgi:hypothetical protein
MIRITRWTTALAMGGALTLPVVALGAQAAGAVVVVAPFNVHEARRDARDFAGAGTAVADLLGAALRDGGVSVADRAPVQRTVALQPRVRDGMLGREGAVAAAKLLGARHVVYGGFTADAAGNVRLDARAVNVGTGAVEFTERVQGRGDDVAALVHELASRLATGMSMSLSGAGTQGPAIPLRALVDYGRGLEALDRGNRADARQLLQGVVRDHPDFAPAKAALAAAGDR